MSDPNEQYKTPLDLESAFWQFVDLVGWQDAPHPWIGAQSHNSTITNSDHTDAQLEQSVAVLQTYSLDQQIAFRAQFIKHREVLRQVLSLLSREDEENEVSYRLPISGGDSFDDLCAHIIGRGKDSFEAVVANPQSAAQITHYTESFWYVFNNLPNPELEAFLYR